MGESWYGSVDKSWFYVSLCLSDMLLIGGLAAGCEAAGSSPDHPQYVECVDK